jgi:hypothetical protein
MRRGEENRHRTALRVADERRRLAADRVHDRADVIHPRLEVRQPDRAIGQSGAALVEADQAGERAEPVQHVRRGRVRPVVVEVRHEAGNEDEVERPVAGHLVGDVHVAALRVLDRRAHAPDLHTVR